MTSRCNHVGNLNCSLGLQLMKENDVNWVYCAQVNIWYKGDVGGGGGGTGGWTNKLT